jgi:hemerythrin-like domain-containing protein
LIFLEANMQGMGEDKAQLAATAQNGFGGRPSEFSFAGDDLRSAIRATADPIGYLEHAHQEQLRLCDMLAEIADSLPRNIDRLKCFYVAGKLRISIRVHQLDEDRGLFPAMRRYAELAKILDVSLERLQSEHIEDESLSNDIIEALEGLSRGQPVHSIDGLAFMLRAFFDSHRRHIAFENEVILPKARAVLAPEDLVWVEMIMLENRRVDHSTFYPATPCAAAKAAFLQRQTAAE